MVRFLFLFLLSMLIIGCTPQTDPPAEHANDEEGMFEGEHGEEHSSDELLMDSREEVDGTHDTIATTEAEALVRQHLNIDQNSDTVVVFDSELNGNYIIHVYDLLEGEQSGSKWYMVDTQSKVITEYNK
jgi:hypothetical protein